MPNFSHSSPFAMLSLSRWRLASPAALHLMGKMRVTGRSLGEYVKGQFYRGIVTGLNEAFVVDYETKKCLIEEHSSSAKVFKPYIRGRNMSRWSLASQRVG